MYTLYSHKVIRRKIAACKTAAEVAALIDSYDDQLAQERAIAAAALTWNVEYYPVSGGIGLKITERA